jgi:hypothetical protein
MSYSVIKTFNLMPIWYKNTNIQTPENQAKTSYKALSLAAWTI